VDDGASESSSLVVLTNGDGVGGDADLESADSVPHSAAAPTLRGGAEAVVRPMALHPVLNVTAWVLGASDFLLYAYTAMIAR
jgi:hypothetical protein